MLNAAVGRLGLAPERICDSTLILAHELACRILYLRIGTLNVKLDWDAIIGTLAPNGRLHLVGAVLEPIPVAAFSLISQQRSLSGSPAGSPVRIETMLDFASRHNVTPQTEHFPMSNINAVFARLQSGNARYRMVLDSDFK